MDVTILLTKEQKDNLSPDELFVHYKNCLHQLSLNFFDYLETRGEVNASIIPAIDIANYAENVFLRHRVSKNQQKNTLLDEKVEAYMKIEEK